MKVLLTKDEKIMLTELELRIIDAMKWGKGSCKMATLEYKDGRRATFQYEEPLFMLFTKGRLVAEVTPRFCDKDDQVRVRGYVRQRDLEPAVDGIVLGTVSPTRPAPKIVVGGNSWDGRAPR